MPTVQAAREIGAETSAVWAVLDDFGGVDKFNPSVVRARIIDGPETGEGATRECELDDGGVIHERIVEYVPGSRMVIEFTELGDMGRIMKSLRGEWSVEALDGSRSLAGLRGEFRTKFGPVGWVISKVMLESMMEDLYGETLDALAEYVEDR